MKKTLIENFIHNTVKQTFNKLIEEKQKNIIKTKLTEQITKEVIQKLNEDNTENKRNAIMKALNNDMYNHAELAYTLYPNMDKDAARSYFSKKFRQEPDDDGQIRHFSEDEINKIYNMIRKR